MVISGLNRTAEHVARPTFYFDRTGSPAPLAQAVPATINTIYLQETADAARPDGALSLTSVLEASQTSRRGGRGRARRAGIDGRPANASPHIRSTDLRVPLNVLHFAAAGLISFGTVVISCSWLRQSRVQGQGRHFTAIGWGRDSGRCHPHGVEFPYSWA
jgi:hypothetical protein